MSPRAFAQTRLPQALASRGYIIHPSLVIEEWIPEGTLYDESNKKATMLIYGSSFPGKTLFDLITGSNKKKAWEQFHRCIALINQACISEKIKSELLVEISGAGPEAILCSDDGTLLILPSDLYIRCLDGQGEKTVIENRLQWINPDYREINPSWSFAFFSGTLAYRIIAGVGPFKGDEIPQTEELARHIRNGMYEGLMYALWNVKSSPALCIDALISSKIANSVDTLLAFGPELSEILDTSKEGIPASPQFLTEKKAAAKKRRASVKKERFFRVNRDTFKIGIPVLILFAALLFSYLNDLRGKPSTKGLTPREIVTGYYEAIGTLDQEKPQMYLAGKVKTPYSELTTNLFVISKVRETYEQGVRILSPAKLFILKNPGENIIYGITRLTIDRKNESDKNAEYFASMYLWLPLPDQKNETVGIDKSADNIKPKIWNSIYKYQDTVVLEWKKDRWKITKIQNTSIELIENDRSTILSNIAEEKALELPYAPTQNELKEAADLLDALNVIP